MASGSYFFTGSICRSHGDERTYENTVALRAVESTDGMTADWVHLLMIFYLKFLTILLTK